MKKISPIAKADFFGAAGTNPAPREPAGIMIMERRKKEENVIGDIAGGYFNGNVWSGRIPATRGRTD